jgi:hypothetical protein
MPRHEAATTSWNNLKINDKKNERETIVGNIEQDNVGYSAITG